MAKRTKRFFGAHVSSAGGFVNAAKNARELGANAIQIHPSPPQRWNSKPYPPNFEAAFLEELPTSGVEKVFFHGIYLINLASPNGELRARSIESLSYYLDLMERIRGDGVIFHVGSLKDEPSEAEGYRRAAAAVDDALRRSPGTAKLLLEIAAGGGSIIGDRLEELAEIYSQVEEKSRVGFALDTQHLWASGYDIAKSPDEFFKEVDRVLSLDRVKAVHLNDSMTPFASRRDRHANIGEGTIGEAALRAFINHPALVDVPIILETPALKTLESAKVEVEKLRSLLV